MTLNINHDHNRDDNVDTVQLVVMMMMMLTSASKYNMARYIKIIILYHRVCFLN